MGMSIARIALFPSLSILSIRHCITVRVKGEEDLRSAADVRIIKAGNLFRHDIGKVTYYNHGNPQVRYFLNAAGTGLDDFVCKTTNIMKSQGKGGAPRYMLNVAKCLFQYDCVHVQLTVDDQLVLDEEILSLSVGNCRYNGGGMMMMPKAIPNDGLFDITAIRKVGIPKFAANVTKVYDGSFINKMKEVSTFRGKKIRNRRRKPDQLALRF